MGIFLLGFLIAYLIISELLVLSERFNWGIDLSDSVIAWVLTFPQSVFYFVGNKLYHFYNYWNLRAVVYDVTTHEWYYCCSRKSVSDYYIDKYRKCIADDSISLDAYYRLESNAAKKMAHTFDYEFQRFFKFKPYWKAYTNHKTGINLNYIPKSVWKHFKPVPKEAFQNNV